jgi:hypothetical protein
MVLSNIKLKYHDQKKNTAYKFDPNEWHNSINNKKYKDVIALHRKQLPKTRHKILGKHSTGHKAMEATEENHSNRTTK